MPLLPIAPCGDVAAPDAETCSWLFDVGEALLESAMRGLAPFIPAPGTPCAPGIRTYVSVDAPPVDWRGDLLAVYLTGVGPTAQDVGREVRDAAPQMTYPELQADWAIDLWESAYPIMERAGQSIVVPDPERLHAINRWVYAHGLAIFNQITVESVAKVLPFPPQVDRAIFGRLVPLAPLDGTVGSRFTLSTVIA